MDLLMNILSVLLPFLAVWLIAGGISVWLGYAPTLKKGMAKIGSAVFEFFRSENTVSGGLVQIPDYHLDPLTMELKPHFDVLILLSASANFDMQMIIYRQSGCKIGTGVIEIIYRKFLQNALNLNANAPIYVYVDLDSEYLYLYAAISENGRQQIEQARNNRRSREVQIDDDLIE